MARNKGELTVIQSKAIALIVAGYSHRDVAIKLSVTQESISKWHQLTHFQEHKQKAIDTLYDAAMAELIDGAQEAIRELRYIINNRETPQRIKVSAITTLLNTISKHKERSYITPITSTNKNIDDKIENALNTLIDTAETRSDLREAIVLQQKQTAIQHQLAEKMTADQVKDDLSKVTKLMSKYLSPEDMEEFTAELSREFDDSQSPKSVN